MAREFLSVIIPTRNRSELLARCLDSLRYQTLPTDRFEILVIDNGSTDGTPAVCSAYKALLPNLRYHREETPGLHVCRHAGLNLSKGDILVYGDDDIRAFPTWLEGIAEAFQDPDVALAGGKNLPDYEVPPPDWLDSLWCADERGRWLGYYSVLDLGDTVRDISPLLVWGCNFSIRRAVLLDVGGFHPDGLPEELIHYRGDGETAVSLAVKARGLRAVYHPKASVHHFVSKNRMSWDYLRKRAFAQGVSDSYTRIRQSKGLRYNDEAIMALKKLALMVRYRGDKLRADLAKTYWEGFRFHRSWVRKDPAVLEWVLRKDYLEVAVE